MNNSIEPLLNDSALKQHDIFCRKLDIETQVVNEFSELVETTVKKSLTIDDFVVSKQIIDRWDLNQGSAGAQGDKGPKGFQGLTGPQGFDGEEGDKGAKGAKGITGLKGNTGISGSQGLPGLIGPKGEKGVKGIPGAKGPQGYRGSIGDPTPSNESFTVCSQRQLVPLVADGTLAVNSLPTIYHFTGPYTLNPNQKLEFTVQFDKGSDTYNMFNYDSGNDMYLSHAFSISLEHTIASRQIIAFMHAQYNDVTKIHTLKFVLMNPNIYYQRINGVRTTFVNDQPAQLENMRCLIIPRRVSYFNSTEWAKTEIPESMISNPFLYN